MSKFGEWINDNQDKIDLIAIKMLGTILTALTIIGYMESVSKFDHLLNVHIIVVAFILLMITLTGYSVYIYAMMTDITGDATLLNYLYLVLAITNQVRTFLIFFLVVFEILSSKQENFDKIHNCTFFVVIWTLWTVSSIACTTLLKKKSPEVYMNLSQKNPKIVMIIITTNLILTITLFSLGFQRDDYEKILFPVLIVAFCILLKVNEDEYEILRRVKKRLGEMCRKSNSDTPVSFEGMPENGTILGRIEDCRQVCIKFLALSGAQGVAISVCHSLISLIMRS